MISQFLSVAAELAYIANSKYCYASLLKRILSQWFVSKRYLGKRNMYIASERCLCIYRFGMFSTFLLFTAIRPLGAEESCTKPQEYVKFLVYLHNAHKHQRTVVIKRIYIYI